MMHGPEVTPLCPEDVTMAVAIETLNARGFGCVGFLNKAGQLTGILTDGDLRRNFGKFEAGTAASTIMTKAPKTVTSLSLAAEVLALLSRDKITAVFVVDEGKPVGIIHVHDCLSGGVL